ncbi:MAG: hypothetical protein ACO1SV_27490 [Fimbriimonas sp.]
MASKPKAPRVPIVEEDVQSSIISAFTALGYEVLQTSRRRKLTTCKGCGNRFRPTESDGASKGVPDLIVTHVKWPELVWLGMEVKGSETRVSAEQKGLAGRSRVCIVRTVAEAVDHVRRVDALLRSERYDGVLRMTGGHH